MNYYDEYIKYFRLDPVESLIGNRDYFIICNICGVRVGGCCCGNIPSHFDDYLTPVIHLRTKHRFEVALLEP